MNSAIADRLQLLRRPATSMIMLALTLSVLASSANAVRVRLDDKVLRTPEYVEGALTVSGSADLNFVGGRLGIIGGRSNLTIDSNEFVDFTFSAPAIDVTYRLAQYGCSQTSQISGPCVTKITLDAFAVGGALLGTLQPGIIGFNFDVSTLFGSVPIERFRLTHDPSLQPTGVNARSDYFNVGWLDFDIIPETTESPLAVPEPSVAGLLLGGLIPLLILRRGRGRNAHDGAAKR